MSFRHSLIGMSPVNKQTNKSIRKEKCYFRLIEFRFIIHLSPLIFHSIESILLNKLDKNGKKNSRTLLSVQTKQKHRRESFILMQPIFSQQVSHKPNAM